MKQRFLVPSLIVVGLCLLALGMGWNRIVPTAAYWTPEQAQEYSIAQSELHETAHSHSDEPQHEQEVAAARARFIKSYQELEHARGSRSRTGNLFIAVGIALLLLGIVIHTTSGRRG